MSGQHRENGDISESEEHHYKESEHQRGNRDISEYEDLQSKESDKQRINKDIPKSAAFRNKNGDQPREKYVISVAEDDTKSYALIPDMETGIFLM